MVERSMNSGVKEMKAIIQSQLNRLAALKKEKTQLEDKFISTKTSDSERARLEIRLTKFILPSIRHLEKTIKSQIRQTSGIESGIAKIKTARNKFNQIQAQLQKRKTAAATAKAVPAKKANHLTPEERRNLEQFEANLQREFGPITQNNIMGEARRMKAEENTILARLAENYKRAKTKKQRNTINNMMQAVINESALRPMLPEEEAEVNAALAQLEGGKRQLRRRLTRRLR
jgi:hypothetical protein